LRKKSIFRAALSISVLLLVLLVAGCGQGLSGQATGEDRGNTGITKQDISDISNNLADLHTSIEQLEKDIGVLNASVAGIALSSGEPFEKVVGALNPSVADIAPLSGQPDDGLDWHLERYGEEGDVSLSETGTTATFGLNLWSQPESDVALSIVSADTGEVTVSPSTLTFTSSNWENIQTITLTGVDEDAEDGTQTTIITVSGVGGFWRSDQETLQVVTADDDVTLPSTLTVAFDSGVDGEAWGNGTFSKCASTGSCGALQSGVFSGREVYVKPHANSDDPNDDWYWAYIFKKWDAEAWIMQYVSPALTDSSGEYLWNAHRYSDGENPWGDWGDVTVTANYD
jgi:hypothetical protein